jgi:hypothetical protein
MSLTHARLLLLFAVLCLAWCRSADDDGESARFSIGDSFHFSEFIMKKSRLSHFTIGHNGVDRKRKSTKKFTPEQLATFWKALEETGVYRWRPRYESTGKNSYSGSNIWDITTCKDGKTVFRSAGFDAYPSDADPQKTTSFKMTDRCQRVINFFEMGRHRMTRGPMRRSNWRSANG